MAQKGSCKVVSAIGSRKEGKGIGWIGSLTTGITSSWTFAGRGTRPRKALRYSWEVRVSMDVRRRMRGLRAHCDQEDKGGDGLLCARHVGRPVYISVMFLLLFRKVFFKWK